MEIKTIHYDEQCYMKGYIHTPYMASEQSCYPAMVIVPGGGFNSIPDAEAERLCLAWMNAGYNAFYLHYHLENEGKPLMPRPVEDLAWLIKTLKEHQTDYYLSGEITLCGLSIGGEIVSQYNGCYANPVFQKKVAATKEELSIDQCILAYGVTSFTAGFPKDSQKAQAMIEEVEDADSANKVTEESRPCFIWATWDDPVVPVKNSLNYIAALQQKEIAAEVHLFDHGPHGLGLATKQTTKNEDDHIAHWFTLACEWLERRRK